MCVVAGVVITRTAVFRYSSIK